MYSPGFENVASFVPPSANSFVSSYLPNLVTGIVPPDEVREQRRVVLVDCGDHVHDAADARATHAGVPDAVGNTVGVPGQIQVLVDVGRRHLHEDDPVGVTKGREHGQVHHDVRG